MLRIAMLEACSLRLPCSFLAAAVVALLLAGAMPADDPAASRCTAPGDSRGVRFLVVDSTPEDKPEPLAARAGEVGLRAPIVLQIHYTPSGTAVTSVTRLGLRFAKGPPPRALDCRFIATVAFAIPPGAPGHEVQATYVLPRAATLHSLRPHMHRRGKSFRCVAEPPAATSKDASSEVLLSVPSWDFDWQVEYLLAEPRRLEAGTRLRAIATYDNSRENPYNPDPAKTVYFGLQSDEEMMIGYFDVAWDAETAN